MPCTQHDDQEQPNRTSSFRSRFSRNFAGLRFSDQQNIQSFVGQPSSYNHGAISPISNFDDLTEQIRISVQDTHITRRPFEASDSSGGNVTDVSDDSDENHHQQPSYSNIDQLNLQQHQQILEHINQTRLILTDVLDPIINQHMPTTSSSQGVVDLNTNQPIGDSNYSSSSRFANNNNELVACTRNPAPPKSNILHQLSNNRTNNNKPSAKDVSSSQSSQTSSSQKLDDHENHIDNDTKPASSQHLEKVSGRVKCNSSSTEDRQEQKQHQDIQNTSTNELVENCGFHHILPPYSSVRQIGVIKNYLFNGSSFSGYQKSRNESYKVNVKIQEIDYNNSYLSGYLCINQLTKNHPSLTTFFEGEIISKQHPFLTRKWDAREDIDFAHWSKFEDFGQKYITSYNSDSFNYDELKNSDHIYMRWKEQFLVPDHTIKDVEGASYAGFYYICFSKLTNSIKGYYYHKNSEYFER